LFSKVLPTFEDEQLLFGDAAPQDTIKRLQKYGIAEIVVKCGADGCLVADADKVVDLPVPQPITAVDTTAAGDSFNGSYLAMRAAGRSTGDAAMMAHKVAATVIQRYGALVHSGLPEAL
jgi:2-dehydro-3-deoxygluconokinase